MIQFQVIDNRPMISSKEIYDLLDRETKKYYSWTKRRILANTALEANRDYIIYKRWPLQILMSIDLTKALLIREGTIVALKLRREIDETLLPSLANNQSLILKHTIIVPKPRHQIYMLLGRIG